MFRNIRFYRLTSPWPKTEEELSAKLAENTFSPCGAYSERTAGWEAPSPASGELLCRRLQGADLFQLRTQSRVLPVAAIKEAMEEKLDEYRQRMAQEAPRSEVRRLKEETKEELLPKMKENMRFLNGIETGPKPVVAAKPRPVTPKPVPKPRPRPE